MKQKLDLDEIREVCSADLHKPALIGWRYKRTVVREDEQKKKWNIFRIIFWANHSHNVSDPKGKLDDMYIAFISKFEEQYNCDDISKYSKESEIKTTPAIHHVWSWH